MDPNEKDESNSIKNQRKLIDGFIQARFAGKRIKVVEFVDDGKSGTNFNRPGITKLLELAKSGEINCIIVKDFSRWGRDYITVSDYLEQIFPFLQIRFISVNDDYDSENLQYGSAGMVDVGFKNIMHDLYGNRVLEQELADIVLTAAKQMALVAIDALTEVDNKKSEAQIKASELKKKIRHMKSQEEKLLLKNNNLFEALMDEKIDNSEYTMKTVANNDLIQRCRADVATLEEELADIPTTKEEKNERKLLKRLLTIEKLDKALVDCLVRSVTIYLEGKIHIEWKFSYFCDIMKNKDGRTVDDVSKMEISNRVWLYYCSDEGWEKLNDIRQAVSECAEKLGLKVVGDSFDNAGLSLTANGFKEMQRAVRQGRVNAVIVPTMEGVSKTTEAYTSFERGIRKRKVRLYDMHGNLIIG